ncbi:MAG: SAM-dependent DNA methyltransferase, partial [Sphingobacteriales bacterium]
MGRHQKQVLNEHGVNRRELGYYSTPAFIADFITQTMLAINPHGRTALDPCVGREELITTLHQHGVSVDGIDIHNHGDYQHCNFIQDDFIDYYGQLKAALPAGESINLSYDYLIANPPYNCHELNYIRDNKKALTQLFGGIGVHNMYSMFISAMVDCAKDGALMGFITSDSFLTARVHAPLRKQILQQCAIHHLILCPSDLFRQQNADVRTCIMILQKGTQHQQQVNVLNRPANRQQLQQQLEKRHFTPTSLNQLVNPAGSGNEFTVGVPAAIQALFNHPRLGDTFKCITGISTGNDALYLSKHPRPGFEIPFYKNPGSRKYYSAP